MAVPVRSDFYAITQFPEVYHAHGITALPCSSGERAVAGQEINTTYRRNRRWQRGTCCVSAPQRAGGEEEDPELPFFGTLRKKSELCIGVTYPYAKDLHMSHLYICCTSAYTEHMHTPGAMNLIPDMHHISILTREKNHENRIYF